MKISTNDFVDKHIHDAVINGLNEHNYQFAKRDVLEFSIGISSKDRIVSGAIGSSYWDWLFVKLLWVDKEYRGLGIGRKIMIEVEKLALRRSCIGIHLDTFSFQAKGFYEKLGYQVFGIIKDHPKDHTRVFMLKNIG